MNNPKISVLMPVYNAEKFLKEVIESILSQTFGDFEFLIINDASTDNSKAIILSFKDQRIRYFENKKNLGVAKTLNKGLKLARGEYVARMDADDLALSERLEWQYARLKEEKNLVLLSSYFDWIDEKGRRLSTYKLATSPEEIFYELQFRNCLGHPTVIFKKQIILKEFGGYDEKHEAEDNDLWLRLSRKYKIEKLKKILMRVRRSNQSKTVVFRKMMDKSAFAIAQNNLQTLLGKPVDLVTVKILASRTPLTNSPQEITRATIILKEINQKLLENYPCFLNARMIKKSAQKKENLLKLYFLITTLFSLKIGGFFKFLFSLIKHFVKK